MVSPRALIRRLHAALALSTQGDLRCQIEFLQAENAILRSRLPRSIRTTPKERSRLVKLGMAVGPFLRDVLTIVSYASFRRWIAESRDHDQSRPPRDGPTRRPGRPPTADSLRTLIIRLARETGLGYTRLSGELRKLGYGHVSESTIRDVLKRAGVEPSPTRRLGTWSRFLRIHRKTLWSCDFTSTRILTWRGWREASLMVFLHVGSRRLVISRPTLTPTQSWVVEETTAWLETVRQSGDHPRLVVCDCDGRFTAAFDETLEEYDAIRFQLPPASPNLNAHAERVILTLKSECLDEFVIAGLSHLRHLLDEFALHYNRERPHSSLDGRVPAMPATPRHGSDAPSTVVNRSRLGGVLPHFVRVAA